MLELRPAQRAGAEPGAKYWSVWRLDDMRWIGSARASQEGDRVYSVGVQVWSNRGTYGGGYGAEAYSMLRDYTHRKYGAIKVLANALHLEQRTALRHAGFRVVGANPPQHAKRRRGYGVVRFEWIWKES